MKTPAWISIALTFSTLLAAAACSRKPPAVATKPVPEVRIAVTASSDCNGGRPVQLLVRAVTREAFLQESYGQISELVFQPDSTVLASITVIPGRRNTMRVKRPATGQLAIYALFTEPQLLGSERPWREVFEFGEPGKLGSRGTRDEIRVLVREDHLIFNPSHAAKNDLMPVY